MGEHLDPWQVAHASGGDIFSKKKTGHLRSEAGAC